MPEMSDEEVQTWIREEFNADDLERVADLEKKEVFLMILQQPEIQEFGIYRFGVVDIKHRKYLTKRLRRILAKSTLETKGSDDPVAKQDDVVYQILAEVCVEDPYNTPEFWRLLDIRTTDGRVYKICKDIISNIAGSEGAAQSFR